MKPGPHVLRAPDKKTYVIKEEHMEAIKQRIVPHLWFDKEAKEAAESPPPPKEKKRKSNKKPPEKSQLEDDGLPKQMGLWD